MASSQTQQSSSVAESQLPIQAPPPSKHIPTLYNDSYGHPYAGKPYLATLDLPHITGYLEQSSDTDPGFQITFHEGRWNFITAAFYDYLQAGYKPCLDTMDRPNVAFRGRKTFQRALGSVFLPILLGDEISCSLFRIVIHAYVLPQTWRMPKLGGPVYIANPGWAARQMTMWPRRYWMDFGDGDFVVVEGIVRLGERRKGERDREEDWEDSVEGGRRRRRRREVERKAVVKAVGAGAGKGVAAKNGDTRKYQGTAEKGLPPQKKGGPGNVENVGPAGNTGAATGTGGK